MNLNQTVLDLFPFTALRRASLSTFYVICPCCDSRVDAFPTGSDHARNLVVCELCDSCFDYTDKDIRQTEDEPTA